MSDAPSGRLEARLRGRVQGVGFRHFAAVEAHRRHLPGFVRNERDGTLTVVAEGPRGELSEFLAALRDGPPSARVEDAEIVWRSATGEFSDFRIDYRAS